MRARFGAAVFLGALLLFLVQPLVAKAILPWYGGAAAVWTVCMLFFQGGLLGGYLLAHVLRRRLPRHGQALALLLLAAAALLALPVAVRAAPAPAEAAARPTAAILLTLAATIGLPYLAVATAGPLLLHWFAGAQRGASPYRLYALSNLGSLLGLLAYPFLVEPRWAVSEQGRLWSVLYVAFALCVAVAAPARSAGEGAAPPARPRRRGRGDRALWVALPACGVVVLLATTNQLCLDVASVPFLWVVPLALYLLTWIIAFDADRWYRRRAWWPAGLVVACAAGVAVASGSGLPLAAQVPVYLATVFVFAMIAHGELARRRPSPAEVTSFAVAIGAGGAAGGAFAGILAPAVFTGYWEFPIGLVATALLAALAASRDGRAAAWYWTTGVAAVVALTVLAAAFAMDAPLVEASRSFYGVLRVRDVDRGDPARRRLVLTHGRIRHGSQFVDPSRRGLPTSYYGPNTGAGLALARHPAARGSRGLRVGVIGLGTGTLSAYGRNGDSFVFFEINPDVERVARTVFTYLADTPAEVDVVLGDARIVLERWRAEARNGAFDVLVLDAFSSDAIPVHLLTREAFELYRWHLAEGGVLAAHLSNRHLDLVPIAAAHADALRLDARLAVTEAEPAAGVEAATWALLTDNEGFLVDERVRTVTVRVTSPAAPIVWTDARSSLWQARRRR